MFKVPRKLLGAKGVVSDSGTLCGGDWGERVVVVSVLEYVSQYVHLSNRS